MVLEFQELEFYKKIFCNFKGYFFKELKFIKLEDYEKLDFPKFEYLKSGRFLHISETLVNWYISR